MYQGESLVHLIAKMAQVKISFQAARRLQKKNTLILSRSPSSKQVLSVESIQRKSLFNAEVLDGDGVLPEPPRGDSRPAQSRSPQKFRKGANMHIGRFFCVISRAVRFHWLPHILRRSPTFYHWLWFTFGITKRD